MGWVLLLGLMVCLAWAPLKLVLKADLDLKRCQVYLEMGYHELNMPGGSERGLSLRPKTGKLPDKRPDLSEVVVLVWPWLPGILKAARYLLPRLSFRGQAAVLFGTGDAAQSAPLYGGLNACNQLIQALWPGKWRARLGVSFSGRVLSGRIVGMIEFRAGHIIYAALIAALEYAKGRIHSWTNTPSKAL